MANAVRGQTALTIGARTFTLAFTANALCELEDATGQSVPAFLAGLEDPANPPGFKTIRLLLWAGLLDQHGLSLQDAGKLIDEVGLDVIGERLGAAIEQSMPGPDPAAAGGKPGKKPKASRSR